MSNEIQNPNVKMFIDLVIIELVPFALIKQDILNLNYCVKSFLAFDIHLGFWL